MAINFPASPSTNDTFTAGSITYKWDGAKWIGLGVTPADRLIEGSNSLEIDANNNLIWSGGDLGIGTSSPSQKLSIGVLNSYINNHGIGVYNPHSLGLRNGVLAYNDRGYNNTASYRAAAFKAVGTTGLALGVSTDANTNGLGGTLNAYVKFDGSAYFDGELKVNTEVSQSLNGVGGNHNLVVAGSTSDTDITDNSSAAITISNRDGTADNTAGLHFAREDTDGTPHYCGASIVAQFKETQVTGQYPKADLAFLVSIAANNAPSEKMRIHANGAITKPDNPLLQTVMTDVYGASQSLTTSPPSAISNGAASISRGTNGFSTTGSNAYTYVCPVDGIYAVFAHISLGNVSQPDGTREAGDRTIWVMGYTLGGGNLPLSNYVEIIDTNVFDYENASYYNLWNFTAGTRVGCGLNSGSGTAAGLAIQWGVHLIQ